MPSTPRVISINIDHPEIQRQIKEIEDQAYNRGHDAGLRAMLTWLEAKYINNPDRPDRGTPEAETLLQLAREASQHVRALLELGPKTEDNE